MYDFNSLVDEILRNRAELTREEIMSLIQEKKQNIGAGFLTDQGALFLIAGELGVQLGHMTSTDLTLKDLYIGANDITIVARVLAIYPISEYNRKDGTTGRYRKVILFDQNNQSKLTIWDDNLDAISLEGISVDSPVRVSNGYVKQGLDGKPNLNLGRKGRIELLGEESLISRLPSILTLSKKLNGVGDSQILVAVEGLVLSDARTSNFNRKDGSSGSLTQFELGGESEKDRIRVVVWDAVDAKAKSGDKVVVTNVRVKKSLNGEPELHGDSGSVVIGGGQALIKSKLVKVNQVKEAHQKYDLEVMALSQPRVNDAQFKDGSSVPKGELIIGDDTGEITLMGWRELADRFAGVNIGDKVRVLGVMSQVSKMGVTTLQLEDGSRIEKISD